MTTERPSSAGLTASGGDADLDARLSRELDAFNVMASGLDDQREFTVRIEDGDGGLLAGLSGCGTASSRPGGRRAYPMEGQADVHFVKLLT